MWCGIDKIKVATHLSGPGESIIYDITGESCDLMVATKRVFQNGKLSEVEKDILVTPMIRLTCYRM